MIIALILAGVAGFWLWRKGLVRRSRRHVSSRHARRDIHAMNKRQGGS